MERGRHWFHKSTSRLFNSQRVTMMMMMMMMMMIKMTSLSMIQCVSQPLDGSTVVDTSL